jgi:hypothetical protein
MHQTDKYSTNYGNTTGGLQAHSVGSIYPLIMTVVGPNYEYQLLHAVTGKYGKRYPTYNEALAGGVPDGK